MGMMVGSMRVGGRSERVVADVLKATIAELGRAGYASLRIEDVATRAGVNKTTIYRRWPTKAALVEAALRSWRPPLEAPDTGSIEGDIGALAVDMADRAASPVKRSLARVIHAELDHPEVAAIARALRAEAQRPWLAVIERAVARGDLPAGTDAALVVDVIWGTLLTRLRVDERALDRAWLESVVRLVLQGVRGPAAAPAR
jgi:AcrR family transcriptional regulator